MGKQRRRAANSGRRKISPRWGPLTIDGDEYVVRTNPPISTFVELISGDLARIVATLSAVVRDHPFVDDDDEPLPFGQWTLDEVNPFVKAYVELVNRLPPG